MDKDKILSILRGLESLLEKHEVKYWPEDIRVIRERLEAASPNDIAEIRQQIEDLFRGTMGSLPDLVITRRSRHPVEEREEKQVNQKLSELIHLLWESIQA